MSLELRAQSSELRARVSVVVGVGVEVGIRVRVGVRVSIGLRA